MYCDRTTAKQTTGIQAKDAENELYLAWISDVEGRVMSSLLTAYRNASPFNKSITTLAMMKVMRAMITLPINRFQLMS